MNFHGQYKTPGGKLVAVDFRLDQGLLRQVRVHGDFFLYPEEALGSITNALEGVSSELTGDELARRIATAIPEGTEWLGSSPAALAMAVQRALSSGAITGYDDE
jgi:lipoate-protein ligase A